MGWLVLDLLENPENRVFREKHVYETLVTVSVSLKSQLHVRQFKIKERIKHFYLFASLLNYIYLITCKL